MSTRTIVFPLLVDDVATDADDQIVRFRNAAGTRGIIRNDTSAVVVAAGTALTRTGVGRYEYAFNQPADGIAYTAYFEFELDGETYHTSIDLEAWTPDDSESETPTAAQMVAKLRAALHAHPVGIVRVNVDGQDVTYSRRDALEELKFWQREAAQEAGTRPRVKTINLGGSF